MAAAESQDQYHGKVAESPAGSECNPYTAYWGDGTACSNGERSNAWCADFAAWAWKQGGASFTYGSSGSDINAWAASFYKWGVATGNWHPLSSGYTPQPGDVAVYGELVERSGAGHVGIYVSGSASSPTVVNGNWEPDYVPPAVVYEKSNESTDGVSGVNGVLDGYVSPPGSSGGGSPPPPPAPADFNGDGRSDLAWYQGTTIFDLQSNGNGQFGVAGTTGGIGPPTWAGVGDFSADGRAGIAWYQGGTLYDLESNGSGQFYIAGETGGLGPPTWAGVGDFNGSGVDGIAWYQGTTIFDLQSNGAGKFGIAGRTEGIGTPTWAGVGDFNGSGTEALAWYQGTTIFDLQSNGNGQFGVAGMTGGIGPPTWAGAGVFSSSGLGGIAWYQGTTIFDLQSNGNGQFSVAGTTGGIGTPSWAGVGDFSGNGLDGLAWYQGNTIFDLQSNGNGQFGVAGRTEDIGMPTWAGPGNFNGLPTLTSEAGTTFTAREPDSFTVTTATAYPSPFLEESGALPAGVTFADNGNGTATLSGTPSAGSGGTYPLTLTASNAIPPEASQSFVLTVKEAPQIISQNSTTFIDGATGTFTAAVTGFPAPAITETGALPEGVTFQSGVLSGKPTRPGSYPITITASNGVAPVAEQPFTLVVSPSGSLPQGLAGGRSSYTPSSGQTQVPGAKTTHKTLTSKQRRARALAACHKLKSRHRRIKCEAVAKKHYGHKRPRRSARS